MKSPPSLSIIVPVFNEEDNVELLYEEIRNSVDQLAKIYEIIFVDDGSSDTTFERLKRVKEKEAQEGLGLVETKIIRFSRNFGQTAAMQAGFDCSKGDLIVSLDADLQNNPRDIPRLLEKLDEGYDLVSGWRKDRKDKALTRIFPSKMANWLIRMITGVPIHDNGCSLRGYRRSVVKSITLYSDMHRFIPAMSAIIGAKVGEIIVNHRPRRYGETKYGLSRIWKVLLDIITMKMLIHFHHRPILWFAIFAFVCSFLGCLFGLVTIIFFLKGNQSIVFSAATFLSFFLFGSLLFWGLLAEFFVKIEKSVLPPTNQK
jgi:glycosyltransferase involved in cell wall biosynthesis